MDLTVDYEAISDAGQQIKSVAMNLAEDVPRAIPASQSSTVDDALTTYMRDLEECIVGAAHDMYGLGAGPTDAALAFRDLDQDL